MTTEGLYAEFLKLDSAARELLGNFYEWLKAPQGRGLAPEAASPLAFEADRYLREFLIEIVETDPASSAPPLITSYLANWYIVNTLYPTTGEIDKIAAALVHLHAFMADRNLVTAETSNAVDTLLSDTSRFHARLSEFWDLAPERVAAWREVDDYRRLAGASGKDLPQ